MALTAGARLGPYEILGALGAGGMGEVYKARDTRLDRTVAIKVLPDSLAADPQFRERFDREARLISQLDHPHICNLHDVGEHDGVPFLVLQHLDGEALDRRLQRGALRIDEALRIAIQIADALDRAHRAGIVHRDLKPANVMLTKAGAKLLDFGLAKTGPAVVGLSQTLLPTSPNLTAQGAILGTIQYMAPEQLEGHEADARSDLFALGAIVYEMVTGRKAFAGKSHASVVASILEHDPPAIASVQPLAPAALDHIVRKCLAKNPEERWQSARDLMSELQWIDTQPAVVRGDERPRRMRPSTLVATTAVVAAAAGALATALVMRRAAAPATTADATRALIATAPADRLQAQAADWTTNEGRPSRTAMAWSPDGRTIVFSGVQGDRQQLYVRSLDQLEAAPIAGTDNASNPFFSPDGRWIGFWSADALRKIPTGGGPPTTICESPGGMYGASWGSDDTIIYSRGREGLWRVSAASGSPVRVTQPDLKKGELKHLLPEILPASRAVLFTVTHSPLPTWDDTEVVVQSLSTGERRVLVERAADGRFVASGHLLFLRRGALMAAPFDVLRLQTTGGAIGIIGDVMQAGNTTNEAFDSGAGQFAASGGGSLLYLPGGISLDPERMLVWVDRHGAPSPLPLQVRAYLAPRLSPDGGTIAVWTQGDRNVWTYNLARSTLTRVTTEGRSSRVIWAPDGKRIAFASSLSGDENVYWKVADGGGTAERLTTCDCLSLPAFWTPDARMLVVVNGGGALDRHLELVSLDGDRTSRRLHQTRAPEAYPDLSPDGRWLAYVASDSGRDEVYVERFPDGGSRQQISTNGGSAPAWSRDGRELFYIITSTTGGQASPTKMMAVPVTIGAALNAGTPHALFEGRYGATAIVRGYDVARDGRFLMVQARERPRTVASRMILVQNWFDELKRKVPVK